MSAAATLPASTPAPWPARLHLLEATFQAVARERMAGVPVLNPALRIQALGFEALPSDAMNSAVPAMALGVLITPWFMNLLRLPLQATVAPGSGLLAVGQQAVRQLAGQGVEFTGAFEPALGHFESCSLFSPMFEFADHATAEATAHAVLVQLRAPALASAGKSAVVPSRRGFLFGRGERQP